LQLRKDNEEQDVIAELCKSVL